MTTIAEALHMGDATDWEEEPVGAASLQTVPEEELSDDEEPTSTCDSSMRHGSVSHLQFSVEETKDAESDESQAKTQSRDAFLILPPL